MLETCDCSVSCCPALAAQTEAKQGLSLEQDVKGFTCRQGYLSCILCAG